MIMKITACALLLHFTFTLLAQSDSNTVLIFDFNEHQFKEAQDQVEIKAVGVSLVKDRFGNEKSAAFIQGNATSYINLGSSNLLKSKKTTISMWVNMQAEVVSGKGYFGNPFIIMKNAAGEDFIIAYGLGYNFLSNRLAAQASKDSMLEATIYAKDTAEINTWYHLVLTSDNNHFAFYVDGELQGTLIKGFESNFLEGDSVVMGRTTGTKNERYTHAIFDDIRIYHRVLNQEEIIELYHDPNPNRFRNFMTETFKYAIIVILLGIVILIILVQNKRKLRKQKEYYQLQNKITELEIKVIKTRMNPHFVSNCLAAIQNLIYTNETDKAARYLARFSFFLRQVLDHSEKTYISLEEELTMVHLNVELEQLRFKDNFTFHCEVAQDINPAEVLIPSLITQPFIENAIWHGLLPLEERDPHLDIRVYLKNKIIFVEIEDNGVGRLHRRTHSGKSSKGTKLVMDKIESINQLRNSTDYTLEIVDLQDESQHSRGTKIIIQLSNYITE